MIINTSQGDREVIGNVKEFKTSIDPKNLEFITTLLSSNLYSEPEQSFIREIVSNAWDSHVEANTTDTPVIIKFDNSSSNGKSITIRDYGTGLSPERFSEIYRNIGSSTKRDSNDYIGCFGIGHLSPFACSSSVYITSYYNGTAYYYVGTKVNNSITYHQLNELPTSEKNGVEISIRNVINLGPYIDALQFISFFPNIYVHGIITNINEVKLKKFNNFAASSINTRHKILLGNVLYPCNTFSLSQEAKDFINDLIGTGIVIKFDVGDLNITPNRESIIYSSETIKKIEDKICKAKKELESLINLKISKDYNNIDEYYDRIKCCVFYNPVTDSFEHSYGSGYIVAPRNIPTITYKGVSLVEDIPHMEVLYRSELPNYKGVVYNDTIANKRLPYTVDGNNTVRSKKILILNEGARLSNAVKLYLKEKYNEYGLMTYLTLDKFKNWFKGEYIRSKEMKNFDLILEGVYNCIIDRAETLDINKDKDLIKFKEELAANKVVTKVKEREAILYVYDNRGWRDKQYYSKLSDAIKHIKDLKSGIILTGMDADDSLFLDIATIKGYTYIKARKDIVTDLRKLNLHCLVDLDWLLHKDPLLSKIHTISKYFPTTAERSMSNLNKTVPKDLAKEFNYVLDLYRMAISNFNYKVIADKVNLPEDSYVKYICLKLKDYLIKYNEASSITSSVSSQDDTLTTAVIIKTKAYRVGKEAYNRVKNNELIRVLCKK